MLLRRKNVAWASVRSSPGKACHYAHSPRRAPARSDVRPQLAARRFLKQFHSDIFHTKSRRHIGMPVGAPVISCF
ncbi:hypothetical protein [Burkholderia seminalis]|uniref:hypothetical protein n=1 Tax=Burkholderia seminalis TaxID=488731 RepID=UPI000F5A0AE5|nr:hypothetical protein [Burkholderia seminalis]